MTHDDSFLMRLRDIKKIFSTTELETHALVYSYEHQVMVEGA